MPDDSSTSFLSRSSFDPSQITHSHTHTHTKKKRRFAFDAMQSAESGLQLAAALAITRASRQAGATAAQKCSDAADAFYGSGCACEPAVVLGLKFVDIVPRRAKEALLETAKKCPVAGAAALPRGENDASVSLAEGISAARELPGQRSSFASSSSSSG